MNDQHVTSALGTGTRIELGATFTHEQGMPHAQMRAACLAAGTDPVMSWRQVPIVPRTALPVIGVRIRFERAELAAMNI
ncbi:hypothetical protein [Rhodococcus pyridinivorans]|jgi:hypothetical protein|uniref:hypothetical protein n=1 Tax=Rhodococcus pyridinivorans TaxID=103816 RepID=UPI00110DBB98|nr:hypothetical protein [Rhodococcus pyridinivorans]